MTHTVKEINNIFRHAAKSALAAWGRDSGLDDLLNDLWVWYLERPSVQKKLQSSDRDLANSLARKHALALLSRQALDADVFEGRALYSSEAVKSALLGQGSNRRLDDLLTVAMDNLGRRNAGQAEIIRSRYIDGAVPDQSTAEGRAARQKLHRAVKSLTEQVNVLVITCDIKENQAVPPQTRRHRGAHGDPTGNTAVLLADHPELRDEYLEETDLRAFLRGAG